MSKKQEVYTQKVNQAMAILNRVAEDNTTPRNIRRTAKEASDMLMDESLSLAARAANVIDLLDQISQDPNMPMYHPDQDLERDKYPRGHPGIAPRLSKV